MKTTTKIYNNNHCIYSENSNEHSSKGFRLNNYIISKSPIESHNGIYVFFSGVIDINLQEIYINDTEEINKFGNTYLDKFYRAKMFVYDLNSIRNINYNIAKQNGYIIRYPFFKRKFMDFMLRLDTEHKLKFSERKYIIRKMLRKKLAKKFADRKKIALDIPLTTLFKEDTSYIDLIDEIKQRDYDYFDFDLEEIFERKASASFALKLINFHFWHKHFIDD